MRLRHTIFLGIAVGLMVVAPVQGANLSDTASAQIKASGQKAGLVGASGKVLDPRLAAASIIQMMLQLLGIIFVCLVVLAGFWLITSKGDEAKIEKAHNTIQAAIVGIIIILISYSITRFVGNQIRASVESTPYDPTQTN